MNHDLKIYASNDDPARAGSDAASGQQVLLVLVAEDASFECVALRLDTATDALSFACHRAFRLGGDAEVDDFAGEVEVLAEHLVRERLPHDRRLLGGAWGAGALTFSAVRDGLVQLRAIARASHGDARRATLATLAHVRGHARTLALKRFLDVTLRQLEYTGLAPSYCGEQTAGLAGA